ncbi:GNAT family N-acetyltransferase [Aquimarina spongiae]|uniref:Acetyltransferase (GNAT) domain-containing protein n=1 Tax=Aquimarina spongiae TaxID=570521 RepID=A0A1M6AHJ5_9FLAO|nr:GNAT family N-acetyltransferase [Aquimarina spongiae]SHI35994.1 Acetyltransferase (GNAT) domain-containing protein [Aquimarina spongiae]
MKQNYRLLVDHLDDQANVSQYRTLLQEKWDNNVYYAIEHLRYFANDSDKLNYFLLEKDGTPCVLMPFVSREIEVNGVKSKYRDVISPYGYNGPLFNSDVSEEDLSEFWSQVDAWYLENNIVSEFIRFSLTANHMAYSGNLIQTLSNVRGNLLGDFEAQWTAFLPKVRNNYRKAVNYDLSFKIFDKQEITKDVIKIFNDIYVETMSRNNAASIYFFSSSYFDDLVLSNIDNFSIAVAYFEDVPISVELIINYKDTVFAFLGGTNAEYFSYRPNDFLRVKVIDWAIANHKKHYVLGGGMKDGDGLYKNKKSLFPKDEDVIFYTGRKVVNQEVYDDLSKSANQEYTTFSEEELNNCFFPFYRWKP